MTLNPGVRRSLGGNVPNDRNGESKHIRVCELLKAHDILVAAFAQTAVPSHRQGNGERCHEYVQESEVRPIDEMVGEDEEC